MADVEEQGYQRQARHWDRPEIADKHSKGICLPCLAVPIGGLRRHLRRAARCDRGGSAAAGSGGPAAATALRHPQPPPVRHGVPLHLRPARLDRPGDDRPGPAAGPHPGGGLRGDGRRAAPRRARPPAGAARAGRRAQHHEQLVCRAPRPLRSDRGRAAERPQPGRGRGPAAAVRAAPHPGRPVPTGRQQRAHGSGVPHAVHAEAGGAPPLQDRGRVDVEGAGQALAAGRAQQSGEGEEVRPPRAGGHPREH